MIMKPTKYQYRQIVIDTPPMLYAYGFRFTCWQIIDLTNQMASVFRVNCLNKLDGSTATKWFDTLDALKEAINQFDKNSQDWDFN